MAKKAENVKEETVNGGCDMCGGTKFQEHERGSVVNGKFEKEEAVFACVGCHKVFYGTDSMTKIVK